MGENDRIGSNGMFFLWSPDVDGISDPEQEYNRGLRLWGSPCRPLKVVGPCLPP